MTDIPEGVPDLEELMQSSKRTLAATVRGQAAMLILLQREFARLEITSMKLQSALEARGGEWEQ